MGIITFFGVIVTLKLSSPIFKACLSKKGGMGVDMRSIGSWQTWRANAVSAPGARLVLYSCNTTISSMLRPTTSCVVFLQHHHIARATYPQDIHRYLQ